MNRKTLALSAAGLTAGLVVAGCSNNNGIAGGGGSTTPPPTPPPTQASQALDTAQILALARQTSETSSPFVVDGGALTITDTSETTDPLMINTM